VALSGFGPLRHFIQSTVALQAHIACSGSPGSDVISPAPVKGGGRNELPAYLSNDRMRVLTARSASARAGRFACSGALLFMFANLFI
jgi:hypothetical protein